MREKRSFLNRVMMVAYMVWYLLLPSVLLVALYGKVDIRGLHWISCFSGLGLLLFLVGGFVLVYESFPHDFREAVILFIPALLNHILYLIFYGTAYLLKIITINASISLCGIIFSVVLATFFHPWYDEGKQDKTGAVMLIYSFKKKLQYIKKNPWILVGFVVLLMLVFSAVYFTLASGIITYAENGFSYLDIALYMFSLINMVVFNYRQFSKYLS
jgi:hypothetical protein